LISVYWLSGDGFSSRNAQMKWLTILIALTAIGLGCARENRKRGPRTFYLGEDDNVKLTVPADQVYFFRKPHDCDFLQAPIGRKHCHYEPVEHLVLLSRNENTDALEVGYTDFNFVRGERNRHLYMPESDNIIPWVRDPNLEGSLLFPPV